MKCPFYNPICAIIACAGVFTLIYACAGVASDELEARVATLENVTIESLRGQLQSITKSLEEFKTTQNQLSVYVTDLQTEVGQLDGQDYASLKLQVDGLKNRADAFDTALSNLETYVNQKGADLQQWVKDYYTSQEKFNELKGTVTGISNSIIEIVSRLNGLDQATAGIAQDLKDKTDKLTTDLTACRTDIDRILGTLEELGNSIDALEQEVAAIISSVQSVVVVPDYTDGSVSLLKVADNKVRFEVYPLEAAASIAETGVSILSMDYVETLTKSSEDFVNLPITAVEFTGKTLLFTVDGTNIPETILSGTTSACARLKISGGTITCTSEYFPICRPKLTPGEGGVAITGESADVGESSAKLYGWSNQVEVAEASVVYGVDYSTTDLTTDAMTLRADARDSDNKYFCRATDLPSNTLYYYRAFTLFGGVRTYGEVKTFTTKKINASVTTLEATNIKGVSATLNGILSDNNQEDLSKNVGFLYSPAASDIESLKTLGYFITASLNEDGSFSASSTDFPVETTLYYVAWARVYDKEFYGEVVSFTTTLPEGPVDMGLSVKWASCNLCEMGFVSSPDGYGDYYAWGETEPYYSSQDPLLWKDGKTAGYFWTSYSMCNGSSSSFTKYNSDSSYGMVDNKTHLEMADDAASQTLGGNWRIPTAAEWDELSDNCTWTWTSRNGINGQLVTATNGNKIFLPAAGRWYKTDLGNVGSYGHYWSSSLSSSPIYAQVGKFSSDALPTATKSGSGRFYGLSVRPVYEE